MKPSPYQIAAFTEAARARSFSRAAAALGVTQSSVTQHVAKLEGLMGAQLFVRRRDGLELTRAGRELFEVSDRLRTLEEIVEERIQSYATLSGGHMTVIANAPRPALPIIARHAERYPGVLIDFALCSWTEARRRLAEREVDVGILTEPETGPGLHAREIGTARYRAVLRRDDPRATADRLGLAEIAEGRVILPEDGSFTQRVVAAKLAAAGLSFDRMLRTWTFAVVKEAVLHGIGTGIMLEDCLHPSRSLVEIPIVEMPEAYRNCVVTPAEKRDLRLVRSFLETASEAAEPAGRGETRAG